MRAMASSRPLCGGIGNPENAATVQRPRPEPSPRPVIQAGKRQNHHHLQGVCRRGDAANQPGDIGVNIERAFRDKTIHPLNRVQRFRHQRLAGRKMHQIIGHKVKWPFKASTAAHCAIEFGLMWIETEFAIALIRAVGPVV